MRYATLDDYILAIRAQLVNEYHLPLDDAKTIIKTYLLEIKDAYHLPQTKSVVTVADDAFHAFATKELGYIPDADVSAQGEQLTDTPMGLNDDNPVDGDYEDYDG